MDCDDLINVNCDAMGACRVDPTLIMDHTAGKIVTKFALLSVPIMASALKPLIFIFTARCTIVQ